MTVTLHHAKGFAESQDAHGVPGETIENIIDQNSLLGLGRYPLDQVIAVLTNKWFVAGKS